MVVNTRIPGEFFATTDDNVKDKGAITAAANTTTAAAVCFMSDSLLLSRDKKREE